MLHRDNSVLVWQSHSVLVWQSHNVLVWQSHSVLVWQSHRGVRAAAAGGRANSDPTGVHPPTQDCYPPAGGDDGSEVAVKCKVGVHAASVLAGNLGSRKRIKYGLLGDGVNLSARLKGLNSKYGTKILTTDQLLKPILDRRDCPFISRPIDLVAVKGTASL